MSANVRHGVAKPKAPRRAAHFWEPLNSWWRSWLSDKGRRPVSNEVEAWYNEFADAVWGDAKPSWKEARTHAKCLRSTEAVKLYFRGYRARNKGGEYQEEKPDGQGEDAQPEEEEGQPSPGERMTHAAPDRPPLATRHASADLAQNPCFTIKPDPIPPPTSSLGHPMTVTTGNVAHMWQRSASERLLASRVLPQLGPGQEQQPPDRDRSSSSLTFQPSIALHSQQPHSPYISATQQDAAADRAPNGGLLPGSSHRPSLPTAPQERMQSFGRSSKRRHTTDDGTSLHNHNSPFLASLSQLPPSFSQGSFNQQHARPMARQPHSYPNWSGPVDTSYQQPESLAQELEGQAGSFYMRASPPSSPQAAMHAGSFGHRPAAGQGGYGFHASEWDRAACSFSQLGAEEPDAQPLPRQPLMGSMDRQLVNHFAQDAAARSSRIEQAAGGGARLRDQEHSSPTLPLPPRQPSDNGGFLHGYTAASEAGARMASQAYRYAPAQDRLYGGMSDFHCSDRLQDVPFSMPGLYPPMGPNPSAQAMGRPAALAQMAAAPAAGRALPSAHPASAQQYAQESSRSHQQYMELAHPFTTRADRSSSLVNWSGSNPNNRQNQNQPPSAAFQQQQQQQQQHQVPQLGHLSSNPSGSSSSRLLSAGREAGNPFLRAYDERKQQGEQLTRANSLGLPFQGLRMHGSALAPGMDQGKLGQSWSQQETGHMEWDGRQMPRQGLEGLEASL